MFHFLVYVASTAALGCMAVYAILAASGKSRILYSLDRSRELSFGRKAFAGLAAVGFFVCIFQGIRAMLGWMPDSWGQPDESGDFQTARVYIASMASLPICGALIYVISSAVTNVFRVADLEVEAAQLRELLDASLDLDMLNRHKEDFGKRIEGLQAARRKALRSGYWQSPVPEDYKIAVYSALIGLAEKQQDRLRRRGTATH